VSVATDEGKQVLQRNFDSLQQIRRKEKLTLTIDVTGECRITELDTILEAFQQTYLILKEAGACIEAYCEKWDNSRWANQVKLLPYYTLSNQD
jgi:hypothetical protein